MRLLFGIISIVGKLIHLTCSVLFCIFAGIFVAFSVFAPPFELLRGRTIITSHMDRQIIHGLFPGSTWNDFEPCGLHFNEQEEFDAALQCVNTKVWPKTPIVDSTVTHLPRCYIVKAHSPDVFTSPEANFNFVPIFQLTSSGVALGAVVGVYQPETRTVFVVENADAAMIYRHELQHYFLHAHDPETEGGGHDQNIWKQCEPPYYTPSGKGKKPDAATRDTSVLPFPALI